MNAKPPAPKLLLESLAASLLSSHPLFGRTPISPFEAGPQNWIRGAPDLSRSVLSLLFKADRIKREKALHKK